MDFTTFWSIYGSQIISIITGVLTATGLTAYLSSKVTAWLDKNDRRKTINEIIEACVGLAERQEPKLSGSEKYAFATVKASEWLCSVGIEISEAELEIAIEKACNVIKSAGKKTAEEIECEVLSGNAAAEELCEGKGDDKDE